jgi:hypothetical protein
MTMRTSSRSIRIGKKPRIDYRPGLCPWPDRRFPVTPAFVCRAGPLAPSQIFSTKPGRTRNVGALNAGADQPEAAAGRGRTRRFAINPVAKNEQKARFTAWEGLGFVRNPAEGEVDLVTRRNDEIAGYTGYVVGENLATRPISRVIPL